MRIFFKIDYPPLYEMKNLVAVVFLILIQPVYAQDADPYADQVNLHDGTILFGKIIFEDDQLLKLKIEATDQIISIKQNNVVKIIKNEGRFYFHGSGKYDYLKGSYFQLSFGKGFGTVGSSYFNLQIARRITPRLSLGPGMGFVSLTTFERFVSYQFVDTYVHVRSFLSRIEKVNKWYLAGKFGFAFPAGKNTPGFFSYSGGPMLEPAFGLRWSSKRKAKCSLELAYRMQSSRGTIERIPPFLQFHFDQEFTGSEKRIFLRSLLRFNVELN